MADLGMPEPGSPIMDPVGTQGGGVAGTGVPQGVAPIPVPDDPYQGKSVAEVAQMHKEAERLAGTQGEELGQLRDFVGRVGMFFKVDGDNVTLNDDMIKKYAEVQGWLQPEVTENAKPDTVTGNGNQVFEPTEQDTIKKMIDAEVSRRLQEEVHPLQQQFVNSQKATWIEKCRDKYGQEFVNNETRLGEFITRTGYKVDSPETLAGAYVSFKANSGSMIDKGQVDALQAELLKAQQVLNPGGSHHLKPTAERTTSELLGLETQDTPEKRAFETLTGKPFYK